MVSHIIFGGVVGLPRLGGYFTTFPFDVVDFSRPREVVGLTPLLEVALLPPKVVGLLRVCGQFSAVSRRDCLTTSPGGVSFTTSPRCD